MPSSGVNRIQRKPYDLGIWQASFDIRNERLLGGSVPKVAIAHMIKETNLHFIKPFREKSDRPLRMLYGERKIVISKRPRFGALAWESHKSWGCLASLRMTPD